MKLIKIMLLFVLFAGQVVAQDLQIIGTKIQKINLPATSKSLTAAKKKVVLLDVKLSPKAKQHFAAKAKQSLSHPHTVSVLSKSSFPEKIQLGMGNVPVLDQGNHGTCVTFAVTAAIDAALNKGDYLSQLCLLQLGNYLERNGYTVSGWDGTWGRYSLSLIETFGFVNQEQQKLNGCGSLTSYPLDDEETPETYTTPEEYHQMSEDLLETPVSTTSLLDIYQAMNRFDTNRTLDEVKTALKDGNRVTFGVLLWDVDLGVAGAVGTHQASLDTWVLTPEISRDIYLQPYNVGGHEMVITGYDDRAVAIDDQGRKYQGLLTLRNSWGNQIGDQGDFYMSYDYFKLLVIEASLIRTSQIDDTNDDDNDDD